MKNSTNNYRSKTIKASIVISFSSSFFICLCRGPRPLDVPCGIPKSNDIKMSNFNLLVLDEIDN